MIAAAPTNLFTATEVGDWKVVSLNVADEWVLTFGLGSAWVYQERVQVILQELGFRHVERTPNVQVFGFDMQLDLNTKNIEPDIPARPMEHRFTEGYPFGYQFIVADKYALVVFDEKATDTRVAMALDHLRNNGWEGVKGVDFTFDERSWGAWLMMQI